MPRLIRGIARTAVVAGTATAVSGRVQHRQAAKYADRDAQVAAEQAQASEQAQAPTPTEAPPPASESTADMINQLKELAALKKEGILTEEEFEVQKARLLA